MKKYFTILAIAGTSCVHAQDSWVIQYEATPAEAMRQSYELQQIRAAQERAEHNREFQAYLDREQAKADAFSAAQQARSDAAAAATLEFLRQHGR